MIWDLVGAAVVAFLLGVLTGYQVMCRFRRLVYERDCYRTALDVLRANGFFTPKADELVRQCLPR